MVTTIANIKTQQNIKEHGTTETDLKDRPINMTESTGLKKTLLSKLVVGAQFVGLVSMVNVQLFLIFIIEI